jgi:hypothetical protein
MGSNPDISQKYKWATKATERQQHTLARQKNIQKSLKGFSMQLKRRAALPIKPTQL